ncbi:MAG: T9SS type A sorting domain-containing protein [Bacteroidota bacterium]
MLHTLQFKILLIGLFITSASPIFSNIDINDPENITECFQSESDGFDLTINDEIVLGDLSPESFSVYYFDNQQDSNNNNIENAISNPTNYSTGSFGLNQVWVNVVEDADETNFDNSTFLLISNQEPIANNPGPTNLDGDVYVNICDAENAFDLTSLNNDIIGSQNGNFIITYFENNTDAINNQNSIQDPENFTLDENNNPVQNNSLVARIGYNNSNDCFATVAFNLNTYQQDENDIEIVDLVVCSNSTGLVTVNYEDAFIVNNDNIDAIISFNGFQIIDDGGNGFIPISNSQSTLTTYNPYTVQISYIVNMNSGFLSENCTFTETFTVSPTYTPQIQNIDDILSCSPEDEEITFDLTQNEVPAIGNQTGNFTISYHFTLPEANAGINSVTDAGLDPTEFTLDNYQQFIFMRIENTDEPSCFSVDFFTLQDAGNLTAFEPENTDFCSLPGESNLNVDLSEFDVEIIGDQDAADLEVAYFENEVLIENPSAYNLTDQTTTITAELSNSSFTDCSDEVTFEVFLNQTPEIQNLNDLENCTDFDLETTFDLSENTSEAIGNQAATEIEINYFTTFQDAENKENQISDITDYTVNSASETIYVRLENSTSESCYAIDSFELISYPVEINSVSDITECTTTESQSAFFDLTEIETELFSSEWDVSQLEIQYVDENDEEIDNPSDYEATSNETIDIMVNNIDDPDCTATTSFNLWIEITPEIQNLNDLENCTDFDLETTFDLSENTSEAIGNQSDTEIEINYFTTFQDAENKENQISDITDYTVNSASETIYVRLENSTSESCYAIDSFELISYPVEINSVSDITECTTTESQSAFFDLTEIETELFSSEWDVSQLEIQYVDENDEEIDNPSDYEATSNETIDIMVNNIDDPDCTATTSFNLWIEITPEIQNLNDLENCTDFDLETTFDLSENTSEAIGNQSDTEIEINYFTTFQDAENKENQISDITDYTVNSASETIYVRLENSTSESCYAIDSFELISYPVEINSVSDITECIDPELENAVFDLTEIEQDLLGENQEFSSYAVSFFDEAGEEVFDFSDYMINDSQVVTARVTNTNNTECFVETDINLIVLEADNPQCDLSVNDENKVSIEVYPNPVSSTVFIESQFPITGVKVFDIKGKLVKQSTANNIKEINISEFSQGVYLMQVELENRQQTFKLIKE